MKNCIFLVSTVGHALPHYGLGDFAFQPGDTAQLHPTLAGHWEAAGIVSIEEEPKQEPAAPAAPAKRSRKGR